MVKKFSLDTLAVCLILLTPLLRYYDVPVVGVSFETLFTLLLLGLCVLLYFAPRQNAIPAEMKSAKKWFALFLAWLVLVTAVYELGTDINMSSALSTYNLSALIMPLLRALSIYLILSASVRTDACISLYTFFVRVVALVYILQWLLLLAGVRVSFKLPFGYNAGWAFLDNKIFGMNAYPTALFSEKSHVCEYLIPYIAMCLYSDSIIKKDRIKKALFYTLCVISTVSGNGIIVAALMWLLYFVFFGKFKRNGGRLIVALSGVALLIGAYLLLASIPRFADMFNVLFVDNSGAEFESAKADYRVYRGFDIYFRMPSWSQLLGVGYQHMFLFAKKYDIVSIYDYSWKTYEYFSAVCKVLLYSGLVGAVFCFAHIRALFKSKSTAVKGLLLMMMALWFSTEMLFNCTHVMYILLIVALLCKKEVDKT